MAPRQAGSAIYSYPATVVRVIDGDTVRLNVDLGFYVELHDRTVRIAHIDAPELTSVEGKTSRDYARTLLGVGDKVELLSHELDKYGRVLGTIILADARDFGSVMVAAGMAAAYEGGKR